MWFFIPRSRLRACVLLALPLAAAATAAESPHPGGVLRLADAAELALRAHPDLQRFEHDRAAASGRRLQAGLGPNPELGIDFENFAGGGDHRKADALETTLRLGLVWQRGAKREARLDLAEAHLAQVDADFTLAQLDVLAQTTRHFIDVVESQEQLALAQRAAGYATQTLEAAERRVRAGAASSLEINRARIAVERAQLEQEHYEHLLAAQRRRLSAQWGEEVPGFSQAAAELRTLPASDDYAVLLARLRRSPDYARFDVEARLRGAELALARAQAQTDPVLSAGVRRFEASGDAALVATMLWPLPLRNRNEGAIAEAVAQRDRVAAERHAAAVRAETVLFDAVQELRHARTMVEALRDVLVPQADQALQLTRRGYANGRYSQIDLLDAQKTRLELERELLVNAAEYHRTLAAVERMTALAADSTGSPAP